MLKSRKIMALILAVMLVFSALSCVTLSASAETTALPEGYMVVNKDWSKLKTGDKFEYTLGGEVYALEYGRNAFATIEAASAPWVPEGVEKTIVLAPGVYSEVLTLTSDVKLCGPYFGKSPNNKPGTDYYDPSLPDWALANGRSLDPSKEAVFTEYISIGNGCNNLTIDGIAFTGVGRVTDSGRTNAKVEVNYNFKNIYSSGSTTTTVFVFRNGNMVNRHISIDSCRIENSDSMTNPATYYAETFELTNSYVGNICAGSSTNVQFYMYAIPVNNVIHPMMMVRNTFKGNRFESTGGGNLINFANRDAASSTITQRIRVRLEVIDNEFIDASISGRAVQCQFAGLNHEFICTDNLFKLTSDRSGTANAIGEYDDGAYTGSLFQFAEVTRNTFYGYKNEMSASWSNVYDNVAYTANGSSKSIVQSGCSGKLSIGVTDLTKYGDAEVLTYKNTNRIYVDLTESKEGIYTFPKADEIVAGGDVTCTVYSDAACEGNPITRIALQDNITFAYLKVVASNGTTEIYTIYIFGYPGEDVVLEGSSQCSLLTMLVPGASVIKTADGYIVTAKDGVKSISPELMVSNKASYNFYLDAACKYGSADPSVVKLDSLVNKFFIKVVAEDGTESKAVPVTVLSERKSVSYTDSSKIPSYARTAVNYLNQNGFGIFGGDNNGKLNPRNNISRYELAKVMVVLSGINVEMAEGLKISEVFDDFYDIQGEAPWAIPYVRAAYAAGLIEGVSDSQGNLYYNGTANTTREQFATVFVRSVATAQGTTVNKMYKAVAAKADAAYNGKYADQAKVSSWALKAVKLANYYGYVNGDGTNFNPNANIIRADVAVVIYNSVK